MDPADYTVGWICALPIELAAALGMLDKLDDAHELQKHPHDTNKYSLGQLAHHKVVLTCLPAAGNNHAGSALIHMSNSFPKLQFVLMVGIGGGIPSRQADVRLGDVVVSMPAYGYPGVVQYDFGRFLQGKEFRSTGALRPPPRHLQNVVNHLKARHESEENYIAKYVNQMIQKKPKYAQAGTDYRRPVDGSDLLFQADYTHEGNAETCANCDPGKLENRPPRLGNESILHYGNIASGNGVVRDAVKRNQLGNQYGALCVEMEAAGLMDESDCLVIRGICDYSDSHKNKDWQRYAAAAAAAYAKELLGEVPSSKMAGTSPIPEAQHWGVSPHDESRHCMYSPGPLSKHSLPEES